jgi:DNA polymerase-3 subunit epsilon
MMLARLLQMLMVRAHAKGVDGVEELIEESKASSQLRRTH